MNIIGIFNPNETVKISIGGVPITRLKPFWRYNIYFLYKVTVVLLTANICECSWPEMQQYLQNDFQAHW